MDAIDYYSGDPYGTGNGSGAFPTGSYDNSASPTNPTNPTKSVSGAGISNAFTAGGGIVGAAGALVQGQMTSDSLNVQANYLDQQGQEAEAQGKYDAFRQQLIAGKKIGAGEAGYGAAGVSSNSGSALQVMQASNMNAELDRLNILHGADLKAINLQNQAALDRFGADSAETGAKWAAFGDIVGAAGKIAAGGAG